MKTVSIINAAIILCMTGCTTVEIDHLFPPDGMGGTGGETSSSSSTVSATGSTSSGMQCVPSTSCADIPGVFASCGAIWNGCEIEECGPCDPGLVCGASHIDEKGGVYPQPSPGHFCGGECLVMAPDTGNAELEATRIFCQSTQATLVACGSPANVNKGCTYVRATDGTNFQGPLFLYCCTLVIQ